MSAMMSVVPRAKTWQDGEGRQVSKVCTDDVFNKYPLHGLPGSLALKLGARFQTDYLNTIPRAGVVGLRWYLR